MATFPPNITIVTTRDGSPTLSFCRPDGYAEKMHHSAGALGESVYIYHSTVAWGFDHFTEPVVLSMGLGLGYNELLSLGEGLRRQRPLVIHSFEAVSFLRDGFSQWASQDETHPLSAVLSDVNNQVASQLEIRAEDLRRHVHGCLQDGRLKLHGPYPESALGVRDCNTVLYDAYSSKMDPGLWSEDGLTALNAHLSPDCVFASYAATGNLNRALKSLGFRLLAKVGFEGKRESTFAIRGQID